MVPGLTPLTSVIDWKGKIEILITGDGGLRFLPTYPRGPAPVIETQICKGRKG